MWSYWERTFLIGEPDLTIVGSGIVGLNAAIAFKSRFPKKDVLVLERGHLPSGASTKNAGFACFGSPGELLMDLDASDPDPVFNLVYDRWMGLKTLRNLLGDKQIGYETPGSYELFLENEKAHFSHCCDKLAYLNSEVEKQLGFMPYRIDNRIAKKNGFANIHGAIKNEGEGQINTGKMMNALIDLTRHKGVRILNGIDVKQIEQNGNGVSIDTGFGMIRSDLCLIATNGFARQFIPEADLEPARAQVLITNPIPGLKIRGTYHFDRGYYYFRNVGNRLLFGGGRNLDVAAEKTTSEELNTRIQQSLDELLSRVIYPNGSVGIDQRWTGIMGVGSTKKPIIKKINDRVACAVRLGGMGIAIGTLTGQQGAALFD